MKFSIKEAMNHLKSLFNLIGQHIKRHYILIIVLLGLTLSLNITATILWFFLPEEMPRLTEALFYSVQTIMFLASGGGIFFVLAAKNEKISNRGVAIANHVYITFFVIWATFVFCLDLGLGFTPLTYLLSMTFIAAIFVLNPFYFTLLEILSLIPVSIVISKNHNIFFGGDYFAENLVIFIAFLVLIAAISFRNYRVILGSFKVQRKLHELSYKDELTGLLNERSYIEAVDELNSRLASGEDVKFAVMLMDVNNLKATNDAYGHRYGCSLIVRCGHTLPTIFKSSKMFHIGGDEFLVIVEGKDLDNFNELMEKFDKTMLYSIVEYEGKELIFSVARGYKIRDKESKYQEVLQVADKLMYENKKYLKENYNMKGR